MIASTFSSDQLRAALHVGRMIDRRGSDLAATRRSYGLAAIQGQLPVTDLQAGERLLIEAGLVEIGNRQMHLHPRMSLLLQVDQDAAAQLFWRSLTQAAQAPEEPDRRAAIGPAGEELIVSAVT